jgi:Bax protein
MGIFSFLDIQEVTMIGSRFTVNPLWVPLSCLPVFISTTAADAAHSLTARHGLSNTVITADAVFRVPRWEAFEVPSEMRGADTRDKKMLFIDTVLPLVLMENEETEMKREQMLALFQRMEQGEQLSTAEQAWLRELAQQYRVMEDPMSSGEGRQKLLRRVDRVPVDLALAQAAIESGWGSSHSARRDHDLFGMVAFVPAHTSRGAKKAKRVRPPKFASLRESVRTYILTLNSHSAYDRFRSIRTKLRIEHKPLKGVQMADGLSKYSTRGKRYVSMLRTVIHEHGLERYTAARLVPSRDQMASL